MARSIVHGLEREWKGKVQFIHLDFRSPMGKELGRRYGIHHLPALVLLDGAGKVHGKLGMGLRLRADAEAEMETLIQR